MSPPSRRNYSSESGLPQARASASRTHQFLASLDISKSVTLLDLKQGQNLPVEAILDIADSDQPKIINDYFNDEFKAFGYQKLEAHPSP